MKNSFLFVVKKVSIVFTLLIFSCTVQKKITDNDLIKDTKPKSSKNFGELIWCRKKDSAIFFNKKNLNIIRKKYKQGNDKYFSSLDHYQFYVTYFYNSEQEKYLTFSERAYIAGYITNYLYRYRNNSKNNSYKDKEFIYRFLSLTKNYNSRYNEEFKKHNYYNLKLLKKLHTKDYRDHKVNIAPTKKRILH